MMPINREYIIEQTQAMVRIDSVNSDLEAGAAGEGEMARYVASELERIGVTPQIQTVEGDRQNVIGIVAGSGGGRSLMLNAHLDTVGVAGMTEPFSGALRDGRIYGRGSYDMKGSLAAMLAVMKSLVEQEVRLAGDVLFTAVVDEEYGSKGTEKLVQSYTADAAVLTEPTNLQVCRAHRGFVWLEVITHGRAAHGSRYQEGIDANAHMGRFLVEIEKLGRQLVQRDGHPLLGPPSVHIPLINGGSSQSVYAAVCRAELERRVLPGETVEAVTGEIQTLLDDLAAQDAAFRAEVRPIFARNPYEIAIDAPIVQTAIRAIESVTRAQPDVYGEVWWMDSALLADAGIETVILGPTGDGIHTINEWVDVDSLVTLAEALMQCAVRYCDDTV